MEQKEKRISIITWVIFALIIVLSSIEVTFIILSKDTFFAENNGLLSHFKNVVAFNYSSYSEGLFKAMALIDSIWGYLFIACFLVGLIGMFARKRAKIFVGLLGFLLASLFAFIGILASLTLAEASILYLTLAAVLLCLAVVSFRFAFATSSKSEAIPSSKNEVKEEKVEEEKEPLEPAIDNPTVNEEKKIDNTPTKEEKSETKPVVNSKKVQENKKPLAVETPSTKEKNEESSTETEAKQKNNRQVGKYEVFPEAGFYKYRLKANNGEILLVSSSYKTREGAHNGIATLRKNVKDGSKKIVTDKNGFSQFRIYTSNDSRLVVAGEIYPTLLSAQHALSSVTKFYKAHKEVDLDGIPENEVREWKVFLPPINPSNNGKIELYIDEETKKWKGRLLASNGVLLFSTTTYSSKNAVTKAIENIKNKVMAGSMSISRDKQNRYQFRVYSENGAVLVMGETYPSKESAISAASSVRNFIGNAKLIDTTKTF